MNSRPSLQGLHGLIALRKPRGLISKDASRRLERYLPRGIRLGHVGTLDPEAEGVLPLLIGRATRLQDYLLALPKSYTFTVQLGIETTTLDMAGEVIAREPVAAFDEPQVREACARLCGMQSQRPPLYSAVKYKGRPLYDYARKGEEHLIDWTAFDRRVEVYSSQLLGFDTAAGQVSVSVRCSKGTYVRILAQQLARALGSCGTVTYLERTESAGISLEQTHELSAVEAALERGEGLGEPYLVGLDRLRLSEDEGPAWEEALAKRLHRGQILSFHPGSLHYDRISKFLNSMAPGSESSLILREETGRVFGLGLAKRLDSEGVQVVMKRSLV